MKNIAEGVMETENENASHIESYGYTPSAYRLLRLIGEINDIYIEKVVNGKKLIRIKFLTKVACIILAATFLIAIVVSRLDKQTIEKTYEESVPYSETVVMDDNYSYIGYDSYESALYSSEYVVYGTVKSIGEAYRFNIGEKYGYDAYEYYTPIEIEIKELIKGNYSENIITYHALGAIYENVKYDYKAFDTFSLKKGDKIIIFLSENYQCISPDCIILEGDNGYAIRSDLENKDTFYTMDEYAEVIKVKYESYK